MKFTPFLYLLLAFPALRVHAQIYADVTVSHGGSALGTFRILLHHDKAPRTVANFVGLATGERNWIDPSTGAVKSGVPYYDGLVFHRLVHSFMIQGGDPLGTGGGGPGYIFQDEYHPDLRHDGAYVVSMANSGVNSNGSQFFITFGPAAHLDDKHSVFGTVIDDATHPNGRALIDGFTSSANFPTDTNERLITPVVIESVEVSGPDLAAFDVDDPAHGLPTVETVWMRLERRGNQSFLVWDREARYDYPVRVSGDLGTWSAAGNVLSMDTRSAAEVEVTALVNPGATFFSMPSVDYSHTPELPVDIFASGDSVTMETTHGTLTVVFNGSGGGSWSFVETGGATSAGVVTSAFVPSGTRLPGIPLTGFFVNGSGSYARALSAREVTVYFDAPVGPDQLTAIQPSFSFHTATTGWYSGPVLANTSPTPHFKGSFLWTAGP